MIDEHPHTTAVRLATEDMTKVIKSFKDGPKFMGDPKAEAHDALMSSAAPDIQALDGTLSKGLMERLARLDSD